MKTITVTSKGFTYSGTLRDAAAHAEAIRDAFGTAALDMPKELADFLAAIDADVLSEPQPQDAVRDFMDDSEEGTNLENGNDPAAILDIATSLNDAAKEAKVNLSEAYQGFDQFMREIMRCATEFETWAAAHVEFEELDGVWAYEVGGHFMKGAKVFLGAEHADDVLLNLEKLDAAAWPRIAEAAGLPIVDGPAIEKPWMVEALVGGTWEDAEWTEDKGVVAKPLRFASQDEAEAAIRDHVATAKREGMDPRMSDYRAVLDPKLRNEVEDQPLPAANGSSPKSGPKA